MYYNVYYIYDYYDYIIARYIDTSIEASPIVYGINKPVARATVVVSRIRSPS